MLRYLKTSKEHSLPTKRPWPLGATSHHWLGTSGYAGCRRPSRLRRKLAGLLVRLTQMLRLLGARAAMVGVRPEIAQSMVSLGVDLANLRCFSSLTAAIEGMRAR